MESWVAVIHTASVVEELRLRKNKAIWVNLSVLLAASWRRAFLCRVLTQTFPDCVSHQFPADSNMEEEGFETRQWW